MTVRYIVSDVDRAIAFYTTNLGFDVVMHPAPAFAMLSRGDLADYPLSHAARADLYRRLGRTAEARTSYERALGLAEQEPQRRLLARRLAELSA